MANKRQLTPRLNINEPNIVIDGGMEIWPEGTSRSVANNTLAYGSALFKTNNNTTGITLTNSQQSSVPSGTNIPFSNQISKTAAGTLAAVTAVSSQYHIEGYDVNKLLSDEFTVIFWVKASVASNRSVSLHNTGNTHSFVQQYNIASANTWQLVALKVPALSTCPGTINKTNGFGVQLVFGAVLGTTWQTSSLNSWIAGDFYAGVGEDTTWLTGTTHDFSIAGVMILPGDYRSLTTNTSAYRFLRSGRNFQEEVSKTQRYVELIGSVLEFNIAFGTGWSTSTSAVAMSGLFKVVKRAAPQATLSSISAIRYNNLSNNFVSNGATFTSSTLGYTMNITTTPTNIAAVYLPGTMDTNTNGYAIFDARF